MPTITKLIGQSYEKVIDSGVTSFLIQCRSSAGARICAVDAAAPIPASDTEAYFVIKNQSGLADAIGRDGMEGQDIYVRSDSDNDDVLIVHSP